jgi:hypothetical protein
MSRIHECHRQNVPITNYGIAIAFAQGILDRALEPFPDALAALQRARAERAQFQMAQSLQHSHETTAALVN